MNTRKLMMAMALTGVLAACSSSDKSYESSPLADNIPDWVLNPTIENGLAASDCVRFSGNLSVDRKVAVANARLALAQQIDVQVQGLEKTYARRTDTNEDTSVGQNFSSVSKQITKQNLSGALVQKVDIVNLLKQDHLCAQVALEPEKTKELFEKILTASKKNINSQDQKFLYEEFKAFKAEQDLDAAIKNLTN